MASPYALPWPKPFQYTMTGHKQLDNNIKMESYKAVWTWLDKVILPDIKKRSHERKLTYDKKGNERWGVRSKPGGNWKGHIGWPGFRACITDKQVKQDQLDVGYIPGTIKPEAQKLGEQLEYGGQERESKWLAALFASGNNMTPQAWAARNAKYAASYAKAQAAYNARRKAAAAKAAAAAALKKKRQGPKKRTPGWAGQWAGGHNWPSNGRRPGWGGNPGRHPRAHKKPPVKHPNNRWHRP